MVRERHADWKGRLTARWNWRKFSFAYGRWCYRTDFMGNTLECWWEWA